jgi:site-specific recombinase XerD
MTSPKHIKKTPAKKPTARPLAKPSVSTGFLLDALVVVPSAQPVNLAEDEAAGLFLAALDAATLDVAAKSLADATRSSYRWHVGKWAEWCVKAGGIPAELDPALVRKHLTAMAAVLNEDGTLVSDEDGRPVRGKLRPVSLDQRVQALNKLAEQLGVARPGDDVAVQEVMRGIRRIWGTTPEEQKRALVMADMRRLLAVNDAVPVAHLRDRAIVLLTRFGLTRGQMASMSWAGVTVLHRSAVLEVERPTRSPGTMTIKIAAGEDALVCPVAALRDLLDGSSGKGAVFQHKGKPMTRQGIAAVVQRLIGDGELTDKKVRAAVSITIKPTLLQLRNRAMLLTGWYAALRRSNVTERLSWSDLAIEGGEWEVTLGITKTNQEGGRNPDRNWLSLSNDPAWPCAASAMAAWHAAVTKELGGDPMKIARNEPVFPAMDRHSNIRRTASDRMLRMDGAALNEVVQDLCEKAGFDRTKYGAHSLRIGFVTEALTDDKLSIAEVQEVTHHKTVNVLIGYHRRVNARTSNPTKKLWGKASA